jgi:hypothetical protein
LSPFEVETDAQVEDRVWGELFGPNAPSEEAKRYTQHSPTFSQERGWKN